MIEIAKPNYFTEKVMKCGKDPDTLCWVIDNLQDRNRCYLLLETLLTLLKNFWIVHQNKIKIEKLDERAKRSDEPFHITTILPLLKKHLLAVFSLLDYWLCKKLARLQGSPPSPQSRSVYPMLTLLFKSHIEVLDQQSPTFSTNLL